MCEIRINFKKSIVVSSNIHTVVSNSHIHNAKVVENVQKYAEEKPVIFWDEEAKPVTMRPSTVLGSPPTVITLKGIEDHEEVRYTVRFCK